MAKRRRRSSSKGKVHRFRANPRRRRHYRRNPIGGAAGGFLSDTLLPAAIGAAGALAVDLAIANLPFPASMKSGTMLPLVRIGSALGLGLLIGQFAGSRIGGEVSAGGVIVTVYSMAKNYLQTNMPKVKLARYVSMKRYVRGVGFVRPRIAGMGVTPRSQRKFRLRGMRGLGKGNRMRMRMNRVGNKMRVIPRGMGLAGMGYIGPAPTFNAGGRRGW